MLFVFTHLILLQHIAISTITFAELPSHTFMLISFLFQAAISLHYMVFVSYSWTRVFSKLLYLLGRCEMFSDSCDKCVCVWW